LVLLNFNNYDQMAKGYVKLSNILFTGIQLAKHEYEEIIIKTINSISLCLVFMCICAATVNFMLNTYFNGILYLGCGLLFSSNFLFVKTGKIIYAKFILVYAALLIPIIHFLINGNIPDHQYLGIIPLTAISLFLAWILLTEKFAFWISFSIIFLYSAFFDSVFIYYSNPPPQIPFLVRYYFAYKTFHFMILIILSIMVYFIKTILLKYQQKIEYQQRLLKQINLSLEARVEEKTKSILDSKNRIADLASITSHKIRGPLASILGFINMLAKRKEDSDLLEALPLLHLKAKEMDSMIKNMNKKIEEELSEN